MSGCQSGGPLRPALEEELGGDAEGVICRLEEELRLSLELLVVLAGQLLGSRQHCPVLP